MEYSVDNLKREIRIALDQNMVSDQLIAIQDVDTLSLDDIIGSKIEGAARIVEAKAPIYLLDEGKEISVLSPIGNEESTVSEEGGDGMSRSAIDGIDREPTGSEQLSNGQIGGNEQIGGGTTISTPLYWENRTSYVMGYFTLPTDFMRLLTFKMSDWDMPVATFITESDPLYALQKSRYGGLRGNPQKPIVAIVKGKAGRKVLEFYSCIDKNQTVEQVRYLPYPTISTEGKIAICKELKSAVVYYAAYLTALSIGNNDLAASLQTIANKLIEETA